MSVTTREIQASPDRVFGVLADGWLYASWVVGASRIRQVDATWPERGSRLYHSVGVWPALIDDNTEVEQVEPPRLLLLRARAWPSGEASVRFDLEPVTGNCRVTITEHVVAGPARIIPKPLEEGLLGWRNKETLRRLAYLAERRDQS